MPVHGACFELSRRSLHCSELRIHAARVKTHDFPHTPSLYAKHRPSLPCGLLTYNPSKLTVSAASALTCEVTQRWFEFSFFVMPTPDLSLPREMKQQAADSHPADSRALADGWSCHSLIMLGRR